MKLQPIGDKILVERLPEESVTAGGLIIPDRHQGIGKTPRGRGYVRAIGKGKPDEHDNVYPPDVELGDEIVFSRLTGEQACFDSFRLEELEGAGLDPSKDYVLINAVEVLFVVEGEAKR